MALTTAQIQNAYVAFFNRPADVAGLTYWSSYAGSSADLLNTFAQSTEYKSLYSAMNSTQLVNAVYQNLFGHAPDIAGLNYWVNQLAQGKLGIGNIADAINKGAQGTDATIIANKVAAATAFTDALDTTAEVLGYAGASSATLGQVKTWLSAVTDASTSLEAAKSGLTALTSALAGGTNEAAKEYVLTANQDTFTGTNGNDNFRAVAGNTVGTQDQTTLNSSDIIDGGTGTDALIVNLVGGNYNGGARIKNIETLQIGTNDTAPRAFDYNVNAGSNEVTEVTTIVADQINVGEKLTVNNILKTGSAIPTLKWDNEAGSTAGTFATTFRESAVSGDTEVKLVLDDVKALNSDASTGRFTLGTGANASVETLRVVSQGTTANTLNASENNDGTLVDLVGASADGTNDNGALKTVIVEGAQAFGKAAELVTDNTKASFGLTNRAAAGDLGLDNTQASASNLVSLAATVTTLDASAATGDTNIRFTGRVDGAEVNVTYKGGKGADYVEFERGAVNATGGEGNDTFSFITQMAGVTNSGFGSTDSIDGGAGTDTIQVGLNGVGTYTLNTTEFSNKTGIDELDLRGANNDVTVSSQFVAAADTGVKLTIRTDKIVQTSASSSANPTGANVAENNSTSIINLTDLAINQGVKVVGGSGSERVVVDNAAMNANVEIDGGTNGGVAGRYDTITVLDSAVLDTGDLANVKGIEALVLAETVNGNSTFRIDLTEAFLLNNTAATDAVGTTINDTTFRIGSANSVSGTLLNTAADTVTIDISDLLNADRSGIKASLATRGIDVNFANATVTYVVDGRTLNAGVAADQALINAVTRADVNRADAGVSSAAGAAAAVAGLNLTSTAAAVATATITGAAGVDTLTLTDAGAANFGANVTAIENLVLAAAGNNVTFNAANAFTNITGGAGADAVNVANLGTALTVTLGDAIDTLRLAGSTYTGSFNGGNGVDVLTLVTGSNIAGATVTSFETLNAVGANTMTVEQYNAFNTVNSAGGAADTLTLTNAGSITAAVNTGAAAAGFEAIVLANGTNNLTLTGATTADIADATITGGTGTDTITFGDLGGLDALTNKNNVENVVFTAAQTGAVTMQAVAGWTVTDQAGGGAGFVLNAVGNAGQNFVASNANGSVVTGSAGVDTFNFTAGTGVDALTLTAGVTNIDTVTGFNFNADTITTGKAGVAVSALNIATADTGTLVAAMQTAINGALASFDTAGDVVVFTVAAGTAAGTYLAIAGTTDPAAVLEGTNDFIVKLVAYTGTIDNADFL